MRVLVTGAHGRLGRSVTAAAHRAGHQVAAVDLHPGAVPDGVRAFTTDAGDSAAFADLLGEIRPEAVIHLAGIAVPFSAPEPRTLAVNASLTWGVLDAAAQHGARIAVAASSPTVIGYGDPHGWRPSYLPLDEQHPLQPWNGYALSKAVVEQVVRTLARRHPNTHLTALRPCYVITPEEWAGEPTQQGHTVHDRLEKPELAAPSLFNYVDARDVADLVLALLDRPRGPSGQVLFAGAADAMALRPLAELLPAHVPETAGYAHVLSGTRPAFSSERARALLGWQPRRSWRTELA